MSSQLHGDERPLHQHAEARDHSSIFQAGRDLIQHIGNLLPERDLRVDFADLEASYADIAPDEWGGLIELSGRSPLVVIAGERNIGKRTTAIRLLAGLHRAQSFELLKDWDRPSVRMFPTRPGTNYLLDLGDAALEDFPAHFGQTLHRYAHDHDDSGTRLVVTMTGPIWDRCAQTISGETVWITAPPAREVAAAHLRRLGRADRTSWLDSGQTGSLLTERTPPADAARLARAIARAQDNEVGRAEAADEFQSWHTALAVFFATDHHTAEDRALLIAAAVLDNASPLTVWSAAMRLLENHDKKSVADMLLGQGLDDKLTQVVGASVADDRVSLDAIRHGMSYAVLPHLWRQRPPLRDKLLEWIRTLTVDGGIGAPHLEGIGRRLTAIASRYPDFDLIEVITKWANGADGNRALIAGLLTELAAIPTAGTKVRGRLREWAYKYGTERSASTRLAEVVAEVCAGPFAEHYPNQTLVRLKWILNGPPTEITRVASRVALGKLASTPDNASAVLQAVLTWTIDAPQAAARGFLQLADPRSDNDVALRLLELAQNRSDVLENLREGWRIVARHSADEDVELVITAWLAGPPTGVLPHEPTMSLLAEVLRASVRENRLAEPFVAGGGGPEQRAFTARVLATAFSTEAEAPTAE